MRKIVFATVMVFAFSSAAWAGGDKVAETCVDITSVAGGSEGFVNGTSGSKIKMGKCKLQVQLKDVNLNPGETVICIASADVSSGLLGPGVFGNSVVLRGVEKNGKVKMKAKLANIGCGVPSAKAVNWNGEVTCYREDLAYSADNSQHATNWQAACSASGVFMAPIPNNPEAHPNTCSVTTATLCTVDGDCPGGETCVETNAKAKDASKINLLGLCQSFSDGTGDRINPPASNEICRQGMTSLEL